MSHELERISGYLSSGGLFNPELANHDAVRDLIIDCRDRISELEAALKPFSGAAEDLDCIDDRFLSSNIWQHPVAMNITVADLRAASAALEKKDG